MAKPTKKIDELSPFERFKKATKEILSVSRKDLQEEMDKFKKDRRKKRR